MGTSSQRPVLDGGHMIVQSPRRRWAATGDFSQNARGAAQDQRWMGVGFWGTGRAAFQPGKRWFTPQELTMQLRYLKYAFIASLAASGVAVAQTTPPPA